MGHKNCKGRNSTELKPFSQLFRRSRHTSRAINNRITPKKRTAGGPHNTPIYRQHEATLITRILDGKNPEGKTTPAIHQLSAEMQINHLAVGKARDRFVTLEIIEKCRGLGLFAGRDTVAQLRPRERKHSFDKEIPKFIERVQALDVDLETGLEKFTPRVAHHEDKALSYIPSSRKGSSQLAFRWSPPPSNLFSFTPPHCIKNCPLTEKAKLRGQ